MGQINFISPQQQNTKKSNREQQYVELCIFILQLQENYLTITLKYVCNSKKSLAM